MRWLRYRRNGAALTGPKKFRYTRRVEARYPSGKGEVCKTFMRGFDSHPRLQFCPFVFIQFTDPFRKVYLIFTEIFRFQNRIEFPSPRDISRKLLLAGAYPGVVMLLGDRHALMSEQNGYPLDWYAGK